MLSGTLPQFTLDHQSRPGLCQILVNNSWALPIQLAMVQGARFGLAEPGAQTGQDHQFPAPTRKALSSGRTLLNTACRTRPAALCVSSLLIIVTVLFQTHDPLVNGCAV